MAQYIYSEETLEKIRQFDEYEPNNVSLAKLSYHAALAESVKKQMEKYESYKSPVLLSIAFNKKIIPSIEDRVAHLNAKIALGKEIIAETMVAEKYEREQFQKYCEEHPEIKESADRKFSKKRKTNEEIVLG